MPAYRVLLVDDEEEIRSGIGSRIDWRGLGFELVGEAENGEEALELADSLRPDLVMTDIKMPYMDGLTLCSHLVRRLPAAKLVVFSGFDDFEYAKQAIRFKVSEYILKPINASELTAVLQKLKAQLDAEREERSNLEALRRRYQESLPLLREQFYTRLLDGRVDPQRLRELSERYGKRLPVLLRLTNDSQFGINEEDIRRIVENRGDYPLLELRGVQFFSGTQKTSLKKLARELRSLDDLLQSLQEDYGYRARELEYGPGFPVAYYEEEALDEEALLDGFAQLLTQMRFSGHVTLELGRSIAACCGKYFTRVVDLKHNRGQNYLLVDGGMHQIVYFGQYMGMKHPILTVPGKESEASRDAWNICGSLCSMNDILAKAVPLPEMAIGDTLCFHNTGAYCMTEGISLFLSRDIPEVYLIRENGARVRVRRRFETDPLNTPAPEGNG